MASEYYGVNIGGEHGRDVSTGATTKSKDVELVVNLASTGIDKRHVLHCLNAITEKISQGIWPPA